VRVAVRAIETPRQLPWSVTDALPGGSDLPAGTFKFYTMVLDRAGLRRDATITFTVQ
jgi:hypothetical protein